MSEISGVSTSSINNVDGFYTTQGGSGVTPNSVTNSGFQFYGTSAVWNNPDITRAFSVGPAFTTKSFVKIATRPNSYQFFAIATDGTLWYWSASATYMSTGSFTIDSDWHQYGSDTDWTDITAGLTTFGAVKGGNIMFLGDGSRRHRGDGSTSTVSNWTTVNSSGDWVRIKHGSYYTWAINSSGEAYSTGYGYDYQTGLGTTSTVATFTRDKNSLANIVDVSVGRRCTMLRNSSGDVYFTGNNGNGYAGPKITSTSSVNGPTLAVDSVDNYSCAVLGDFSHDGGCHIDSDGYLRFHGEGSHYLNPDGSTTDRKGSSSGYQVTAAGTGWTYFSAMGHELTSTFFGIGIKSGELWLGGSSSGTMRDTFGLSTSYTSWVKLREGVTAATHGYNGQLAAG